MDAFIGTVLPVAFNYSPRGWVFCNGQVMSIAQNSAMFALLGTTYGGDGQTTFGIPDLRGRVIVGSQQQGPGLTNVVQGELSGTNTVTAVGNGTAAVTIPLASLPAHTHPVAALAVSIAIPACAASGAQNTDTPGTTTVLTKGTVAGGPVNTTCKQYSTAAATTTLLPFNAATTAGNTGASTGSGAAFPAPVTTTANISVMQPFLGLNYIICTEGIFPSRN